MARAGEVFRENAIAKQQAEDELRASKEKAENALAELRATQQNLIDAERLAALGLAVPNLFVLPFGTALGIYALWVLLHDEARKMFLKETEAGT